MGNTCYMHSILQCLRNTPVMAEYFNNNYYMDDINRNNILGHKGEVAEEFGVIMKALWAGLFKCISSRDFKITTGKINEQFAGYNQQDSEEQLLFLMDGLHEDLNKGGWDHITVRGNSMEPPRVRLPSLTAPNPQSPHSPLPVRNTELNGNRHSAPHTD